MDQKDIDIILHKLADNKASEQEKLAFSAWLNALSKKDYREILERYHQIIIQHPETGSSFPELERSIEHQLDQFPIPGKTTLYLNKWKELAVVASILLIAVAGTWYSLSIFTDSGTNLIPTEKITSRYGDDILPGSDKATLSLSDGRTIILDEVPEGRMNLENGIQITKTGEGRIAYNFLGGKDSEVAQTIYNTITTPKGGEYQVTLPDGSRVWLNSMSSITTPNIFGKEERIVEVTGEVYFEVVKQESVSGQHVPFLVRTTNQTVEVLGTQFNIKAYPDLEAVETTLVEGKVEVISSDRNTILSPGEQSLLESNGRIQHLKKVNIDKIIAWKNGYFQFSDDSIQDIMNQLSRWYDIKVEYEGNPPDSGFGGQVSRSKNISEVLRILELTDEIRFHIEGQSVKVWKNKY